MRYIFSILFFLIAFLILNSFYLPDLIDDMQVPEDEWEVSREHEIEKADCTVRIRFLSLCSATYIDSNGEQTEFSHFLIGDYAGKSAIPLVHPQSGKISSEFAIEYLKLRVLTLFGSSVLLLIAAVKMYKRYKEAVWLKAAKKRLGTTSHLPDAPSLKLHPPLNWSTRFCIGAVWFLYFASITNLFSGFLGAGLAASYRKNAPQQAVEIYSQQIKFFRQAAKGWLFAIILALIGLLLYLITDQSSDDTIGVSLIIIVLAVIWAVLVQIWFSMKGLANLVRWLFRRSPQGERV